MKTNDFLFNIVISYRSNVVKTGLQAVVYWVKNSWSQITDTDASNALRTGYLNEKYLFNESYIARQYRFQTISVFFSVLNVAFILSFFFFRVLLKKKNVTL